MRIGVISDTHGRLRPEAVSALSGAEMILHAGDVGADDILDALSAVAPLVAIRGNVDRDGRAARLPDTRTIDAGGCRIHMVHDVKDLARDPAADGWDVVISGHSHKPVIRDEGVLFLNPGAAGPRRFRLPVTVAWLTIETGRPQARIVPLDLEA